MSDVIAAWMYTRPRARRVWFMFQAIWAFSITAVYFAPRATADTLSAAWGFTGLHDSYGVPIGAHFVAVVPLTAMIGNNGPQFGVSPDTWGPAIMSSLATAGTYAQLNEALAAETAFLIFICSVGIWIIKFALGVVWLGWLAAIAAPIVDTLKMIVAKTHLLEGGIIVCIIVGGFVCLTTGYATGIGIIVSGFVALILFWVLLRDPVGELVSDNGVLGMGRSLGYSIAQGVVNNGPISAGDTSKQLDTLCSWLVDVLVRDIIQLLTFGQVIDDIPHCADMYNAGLLSGIGDAPATYIKACAPQAYDHALHLDFLTVGLFFCCNLGICVILLAVDYMGMEAFRVGFKAFWNVLILVPAAAMATFPGPPRQAAKKAAARMLLHGAEMIAGTAGLGILVLIMAGVTRGTLPGTIGMTDPLAKVLVMTLIAVAGAFAFRFALLKMFGDRGIPGPIRAVKGTFRTVTGAARTVNEVDYAGRVLKSTGGRLQELRQQRAQARKGKGEDDADGTGPKAPGRKAHPPTTGPGRGTSASGAGPNRPGGNSPTAPPSAPRSPRPPTGDGVAPAPSSGSRARSAVTQAGRTAAKDAAWAGATAVAPEVAVPAKAAAAVAHRLHHGNGHSSGSHGAAPGRAAGNQAAAPAPSRSSEPHTGFGHNGSATSKPQPPAADTPPPAPPGRNTPRPDQRQ
ncbi:hypothetical protein [Mycolicibacterium llatzerense]|uniref:hypothetical protein n=1 Tax=Mycolicibacterium llatzerense TaxID=280871 RepID=UPI0021B52DB8|nr:hypothetical protein [Mycolicibacterium llatzerense]